MAVESYTDNELDHAIGAALWVGSLHSAIGHMLDITAFRQDVELTQWVNLFPVEPAVEIIDGTILGLVELRKRLGILIAAFEHASEVATERALDAEKADDVSADFEAMMREAFAKDRKKNGGA